MKTLKKLSHLLLATLSFMTVSCDEPIRQKSTKTYETLIVSRTNSSVSDYYSSTIKGEHFVDIRPQVEGVITRILIDEGAEVKKGEILFIIDQVPYKAALEIAIANVKGFQAKVATAKLNAQSSKELFDEAVISNIELQTSQNTLLEAQADLSLAKAQELNARNDLSYTEVKSPVDGVTSMIAYRVGALVNSSISEPLLSVSNNKYMHIYFSMTESQILALTRQNGSSERLLKSMPEVELILNDGLTYQHKGKIDAISGTIEQSTGSVSLRALFENPEQILRNGGSGRIGIKTEYQNVIVIPKVATYDIQNKIFVYKVIDGKATAAEIKVYPLETGTQYIVESGITDGDIIIAKGAGLVREGTPVGISKIKKL